MERHWLPFHSVSDRKQVSCNPFCRISRVYISIIVCSPSASVKVCVYTLNTATGSCLNCITFYSGHLFDIMFLHPLLKSLLTTRSQFRFGLSVDADLHGCFKSSRYLQSCLHLPTSLVTFFFRKRVCLTENGFEKSRRINMGVFCDLWCVISILRVELKCAFKIINSVNFLSLV